MVGIIEQIYENKKAIKRFLPKYLYWMKRLFKPLSPRRVYIIGCPEYSNLGDNAILLAMISFLKKFVGLRDDRIECITEKEFLSDYDIIKKCIRKKSLLCGMGGGNMGNKYRSEELIRRTMFKSFPLNPTIIFPQTIFYEGENKGEDERLSVKHYNDRDNLTIVAREKKSKEIMERLYPKTRIMLTPDIVLSSQVDDYDVQSKLRNGIMFCVRSDGEKSVDGSVWSALRDDVTLLGYSYWNTDMYSDIQINTDTRKDCVRKKMEEFSSAELAITDRLHGMVFAALTGTPCIVFSNNNHKVYGTYEWISYLPYIKYANNYDEAANLLPELLKMSNNQYDSSHLNPYFEKLAKEVKIKI